MQQQKDRSRADAEIDTEDWVVLDDYARNEFVGYDELESRTKVVKYRKVKAKGKESFLSHNRPRYLMAIARQQL